MHADRSIQEDRGRYVIITPGADQPCRACQPDRPALVADLSAALMEVIVQARSKAETILGYELCFTVVVLLVLMPELYVYWLLHPIA
ncbi:hypothetical protein HK44_010495 [Pseudomonas fluorescens HK44]|uniref:Uncharacterized protein n=1 Tax=Pseudomonas fluorescens HK44 TaxID=1042209 RepID=A0A010SMK0_PSEFL|nr:hypothetical protein HK44_010495 [Pseudomonas fluorescens HK44]